MLKLIEPEHDPIAEQLRLWRHFDIGRDDDAGIRLYYARASKYTLQFNDCTCWLDLVAGSAPEAFDKANALLACGAFKHRSNCSRKVG